MSSALAKTLNLGQEPGVAAPRTCSRSMVVRGWVMAAEQQVPFDCAQGRLSPPLRNDKILWWLPGIVASSVAAAECIGVWI